MAIRMTNPCSVIESVVDVKTDAQGASVVGNKSYTSSVAGTVILFEIVMQQMLGNFLIRTHSVPRLQNVWADELSRGNFQGFDLARRIVLVPELRYALWFWNLSQGEESPFPDIK